MVGLPRGTEPTFPKHNVKFFDIFIPKLCRKNLQLRGPKINDTFRGKARKAQLTFITILLRPGGNQPLTQKLWHRLCSLHFSHRLKQLTFPEDARLHRTYSGNAKGGGQYGIHKLWQRMHNLNPVATRYLTCNFGFTSSALQAFEPCICFCAK